MSTVKQLHDKAMLLLQEAIVLRHNGDDQTAEKKYKDAFFFESEAAEIVSKKEDCEPTRSILYRSAASLAYQAGELDSSLQLIGKCLSGNPSSKIKDEVRVLYESVNLKMYSEKNKILLSEDNFDFHLAGNLISDGFIFFKEFTDRIDSLMRIIKKTAQRMFSKPYSFKSDIVAPFLQAPTGGGSFLIKVGIAYNNNQQMDLFVGPNNIIDEVIDCFGFIQNEKYDELFLKINDKAYFNHFVSNSKKIAPDGEKISKVDFISKRKEVNFMRTSDSIPINWKENSEDQESVSTSPKPIEIQGVLDFASSKPGKAEFAEVTAEDKKIYKIKIDKGLDDYVRSFYKSKVTIKGELKDNFIYLNSMEAMEDSYNANKGLISIVEKTLLAKKH